MKEKGMQFTDFDTEGIGVTYFARFDLLIAMGDRLTNNPSIQLNPGYVSDMAEIICGFQKQIKHTLLQSDYIGKTFPRKIEENLEG